ncbi:hypothetical protein EDD96_6605 [Streptomyces sp. Ag109_G2-6]|uniref:hypothetical protein n=1 Tax=Streptomyces TaxID=1883 RepID=UPI000F4E4EE8|nr:MULTISPECIES: hypothetical protein [Streptomyces]RPF30051.1 hypothetical protein EDD96_6605 [Streptomyces sp. Ag109_G2-6]
MSEDAQQRKERANRLREKIQRPEAKPEPPERESLKEGVERRMRELDEAEREDRRNRQGDDDRPASRSEDGKP